MPSGELITAPNAARRLGVTPQWVGQMIRDGKLNAIKPGKTWLVDSDDVETLCRERDSQVPAASQPNSDPLISGSSASFGVSHLQERAAATEHLELALAAERIRAGELALEVARANGRIGELETRLSASTRARDALGRAVAELSAGLAPTAVEPLGSGSPDHLRV